MLPKIGLTLATITALGALSATAQTPAPAASTFVEGTHYQRITPAQPTITDLGKVEVAEVFMYSCPGCYAFEPYLTKWRAQLPDNVTFVRIPASFNAIAALHARAFYTAEALGKLDEIDAPFFEEFHQKGNRLDSEESLADFFGRFGVDEQTFKTTFNSFAMHTKVKRADELIRRYRVPSTPSVVVNGKYLTNGQMAGSYEGWFRIIDQLAAEEQNAKQDAAAQ